MNHSIPKTIRVNDEQLKKTTITAFKHQILITLMEQIVAHLCTFTLGEYRKSGLYDFKIEKFLHDNKKAESLGNYVRLIRELSVLFKKENYNSILNYLLNEKTYSELFDFIDVFKVIHKTTIETGEFDQIKIDKTLKGHTKKQISILEFFNEYTTFRNKVAHPLENNRAIFPINDENYYLYFTPLLEQCYSLIVTHFQELWSYKNFIITSKTEDELHLISEDQEPIHISLPLVTEYEVNQKVFYKIDEDLFLSDWKKLVVPNQKAIQEIEELNQNKIEELNQNNLKEYIVSFLEDGEINLEELNTIETIAKTKLGISKSEVKKIISEVGTSLGINDPFPEVDTRFITLLDNALKNKTYNEFVLKLTGQQFGVDSIAYEKILKERLYFLQIDREEITSKNQNAFTRHDVINSQKIRSAQQWMHSLKLFNSLSKESFFNTTPGYSEIFNTKEFWHKNAFIDIQNYVEDQLQKLTISSDTDLWETKINNWQQGNLTGYIWCSIYRNDLLAGRMLSLHFGVSKDASIMTGLLPDWKDFKNLQYPGLFQSIFKNCLKDFVIEYRENLINYPSLKVWDGKNMRGKHTLVEILDNYPWFYEFGYQMDEINFNTTIEEIYNDPFCFIEHFDIIFNLFNGLFEVIDREYRYLLKQNFSLESIESKSIEKLESLIPTCLNYGLSFQNSDIQGSGIEGRVYLEIEQTIKSYPVIFNVGFHQNYQTNQIYFKIEISCGGNFEPEFHQLLGNVLETFKEWEFENSHAYFIPSRLFIVTEIDEIESFDACKIVEKLLNDFTLQCATNDLQLFNLKLNTPEIELHQSKIDQQLEGLMPTIQTLSSNKIYTIRNWMKKLRYVDSVYSNKITPHNLSWGLEQKNNQLNVGVILAIENAHKGAEITDKVIRFNELYPTTECTSLLDNSKQDGIWLEDTITQYLQASSNKKGSGVNQAAINNSGAWCADSKEKNAWIELNLNEPVFFLRLKIQGAPNGNYAPKEIKISYSFDGKNWNEYNTFQINIEENQIQEIQFPSIIAKFLRISITDFNNSPGLRLDACIKRIEPTRVELKWMQPLENLNELDTSFATIPEKISIIKEFFKQSIGV